MSLFLARRSAVASAGLARTFSTSSHRQFARISIVGHLGETPELHQAANGREVVRYVVASNKGKGDNKTTSWWRISAFPEGGSRDYLLSLPKGSQVLVEGEPSMSTYTDAEGNTRSSLNIVQRSIETLRRPTAQE